jgi:RNA polymerase sigma-70 factor (ECF subfamily)
MMGAIGPAGDHSSRSDAGILRWGGTPVEKPNWDPRLSQLSTEWSLVFQLKDGTPEQISTAQAELMQRYAGAVHRYLLALLHDPDAASELDQEFALRFLRGDFHRADPSRGRFRDFVKQALRNLMIDFRRRERARPRPLGDDVPERAAAAPEDLEFDRRFLGCWRSELLSRAWDALAKLQQSSGKPYHDVLRLRVEHPDLHSPELAALLSKDLGRPISAGGMRMALQRARDRFVEYLLAEVAASLKDPTDEQVEHELIDLGLIEYCRPALKRSDRSQSSG